MREIGWELHGSIPLAESALFAKEEMKIYAWSFEGRDVMPTEVMPNSQSSLKTLPI